MDSSSLVDTAQTVVKHYGWDGIMAGHGLIISVTGMLIVFLALAGISIILSQMTKIMNFVNKIYPEPVKPETNGKVKASKNDEEIAIAIALANHKSNGN